MEIVLNRKGGVPVRDQLVTQLELGILGGEIAAGERLPSVRALARRLRLHPNTVSAAYRLLDATGHVEMRRGSGVFVRAKGATSLAAARGLDEMIRVALEEAARRGFGVTEIRAAVSRWLSGTPPDRIVIVDPALSMAELIQAELRPAVALRLEVRRLVDIEESPEILDGAIAVSLPYHVAALRRAAPRATVLEVTLEVSSEVREAIRALPKGAIVLVVSHSEAVLPFASTLGRSLRGDEVLVETRMLRDARAWRRLSPAADAIFADVLSEETVRKTKSRGLHPFRVLAADCLGRFASDARAAQAGEVPPFARKADRKKGR
jgi:GntR family transcriptional regulator